jgi:hypothetical protein
MAALAGVLCMPAPNHPAHRTSHGLLIELAQADFERL